LANASIDILGSFKLNHWYKLAIYLGAVIIILSFVFVNNSNLARYTSFAVDSLVLGLVVWILDDTLYAYGKVREEEAHYDNAKLDVAKNTLTAIFAVRWVGLLVWILIILAYL
jgi:hypothetical protein